MLVSRCILGEQQSYRITASEAMESYVMAHREQHGNRETKKPKKDKSGMETQPAKWSVSGVVEAKADSKH